MPFYGNFAYISSFLNALLHEKISTIGDMLFTDC
jgi:hypothetical protein